MVAKEIQQSADTVWPVSGGEERGGMRKNGDVWKKSFKRGIKRG